MFGFLMRHVLGCIEHVNLRLSWLVAIHDVQSQHTHYSFVSTNAASQLHPRKSPNNFPLPLITGHEHSQKPTNSCSICPLIGLEDF